MNFLMRFIVDLLSWIAGEDEKRELLSDHYSGAEE
jgi:hypothetical protein